jgi:hypothetical protein
MSELPIRVNVLIEFKEYLKLNYLTGLRQLSFVLVVIIPLILCDISLIVISISKGASSQEDFQRLALIAAITIVLGMIGVIFPIGIRSATKRRMATLPILRQRVDYQFSEDGVDAKGTSFESKLSWDMIIKAQEIADFVMLYSTGFTALLIPLRCFEDDSQREDFKNLVRNKLGARAHLRK